MSIWGLCQSLRRKGFWGGFLGSRYGIFKEYDDKQKYMIIEFKFKNYKSYKEETILSFEALENDFRSENYDLF